MRPKDYKFIKEPEHLNVRFGKGWRVRDLTAANPVGDQTIKGWLDGDYKFYNVPNTSNKFKELFLINKYMQLKYKYEMEVYKRKRWVEEVRELKLEVDRLSKMEVSVKNKLRNTLIFQDLSDDLNQHIDTILMDAFVKGDIKI